MSLFKTSNFNFIMKNHKTETLIPSKVHTLSSEKSKNDGKNLAPN